MELDEQIARGVPDMVAHLGNPECPAGFAAGGNLYRHLLLRWRAYPHPAAEHRLRQVDRQIDIGVVPLPLEEGICCRLRLARLLLDPRACLLLGFSRPE